MKNSLLVFFTLISLPLSGVIAVYIFLAAMSFIAWDISLLTGSGLRWDRVFGMYRIWIVGSVILSLLAWGKDD